MDDCHSFAREQKAIDQVISSLQDKTKPDRLLLSVEYDVAGFLGILMTKKEDGTIELNQTGLIDRIIRTNHDGLCILTCDELCILQFFESDLRPFAHS